MMNLSGVNTKILRRRCLQLLRSAQAAGGDGWTIPLAVANFVREELPDVTLQDAASAMRYLAGKGYADARVVGFDKTVPGSGKLQARILPKGEDLLDEAIPPDPGVEDNRV